MTKPNLALPGAAALAGLALSVLLPALGTSVAHVGLPALALAFDSPFRQVQWIVLAYLLAMTALIVGAGRLADLTGRRRLLLGGIVLFTAASALCGAAPSLALLIAARAAQGLGAAAMTVLALAFVGDVVPKAKTGTAMGLLGTTSAIGTALGPSLGGLLISAAGWRATFLALVPLGLAALLLAVRHLPRDRPAPTAARAGFDLAGTLLLALTLSAYALAMTLGRGGFGALQVALLAAAAACGGLFAAVEARAASPLIRWEILRDPALRAGLGLSALVSTVVMTTLVVGPFYLSLALGLDAARVGLVLSVGPLVAAATGLPAGRLVDRAGARGATFAGLAAVASGCAALAALPARLGVPGYVLPLIAITAGYALFQTANNTAVLNDVRADRRGVVSGLLNLSRQVGLITGASAMGALFASASGTADLAQAPPEAVAAGLRVTFAVAAAAVAVGLALAAGGRALAAGFGRPARRLEATRAVDL